MKRPFLLVLLALIAGFGLGLFFTYTITMPNRGSALAVSSTFVAMDESNFSVPPTASALQLDQTDNTLLLERAQEALTAMRDEDYEALSSVVHPEDGVMFTPYSTVDPECNQVLTTDQVAALADDKTVYTWGVTDGKGDPIQMTGKEYFERYVFNADYTQAPQVSLDEVLITGNAMENVADAYPESRFVEYHFPGLDQKLDGYDWCSLKLVFEAYQGNWYLVGVIHSEWTI